MYPCTHFQLIWRTLVQICQKNKNDKNLEQINIKIVISISQYVPCTKYQLIWGTSYLETKFAQKNMNDKNFEKINIKFEKMI